MPNMQRRSDVLAVLLVTLLLAVVLPALLDPFRLNLIGKYLAFGFVAVGIVLTWGYGGVLSLGQACFRPGRLYDSYVSEAGSISAGTA